MKELKVLCNLYLEVDDDTDIEAALDSLYFRLDTDVKINLHSYEFQEDRLMKYDYPNYKLKAEFTPGTWSENQWDYGESACVDRAFYALPDGTEYAVFKFCYRTMTGRKKCRWETWHNGKFANNYFNSFDEAMRWFDGYMSFNGFPGKRQDYRVYAKE